MNNGKKLDTVLSELLIGIVAFTIICQIGMVLINVGVRHISGTPIFDSVLRYTAGLWIGALLACASAYHMWWSLDRNLTINADNEVGARAFALKHSMIRYMVILLVFVAICLTDFAYPLAAFLGIMGLKAGAYLQPVINRLLHKSSK